MKHKLFKIGLILALALSISIPGSSAQAKKPKHSAEHNAAVKKCNDDYKAAMKEAKTKKGKERKDAEKAAKDARKECIKNAPN